MSKTVRELYEEASTLDEKQRNKAIHARIRNRSVHDTLKFSRKLVDRGEIYVGNVSSTRLTKTSRACFRRSKTTHIRRDVDAVNLSTTIVSMLK